MSLPWSCWELLCNSLTLEEAGPENPNFPLLDWVAFSAPLALRRQQSVPINLYHPFPPARGPGLLLCSFVQVAALSWHTRARGRSGEAEPEH